MPTILLKILCVSLLMACNLPVLAADSVMRLAVAANFRPTLSLLAAHWQPMSKPQIKIISGSSGQLYAQIRHGAPFDVFFSADRARPQLLAEQGLAWADSLDDYAIGVLVLAGPKSSPTGLKNLPQLAGKLAMANPRTAPYGRAAKQALQALELYEPLAAGLVYGDSVQQVFHYLLSGHVTASFIALSQASQLPADRFQIDVIPKLWYPPLVQSVVIPKSSRNPEQARQLLEFVLSPAAQQLIEQAGYQPTRL